MGRFRLIVLVSVALLVAAVAQSTFVANQSLQPKNETANHGEQLSDEDDLTPAENELLQKNYAGTGDAEHVTASSPNKYICVAVSADKLSDNTLRENVSKARYLINHDVVILVSSGSLSVDQSSIDTATTATQSILSFLSTAHSHALATTQECDYRGILGTGVAQFQNLLASLQSGTVSSEQINAASNYSKALAAMGISESPTP